MIAGNGGHEARSARGTALAPGHGDLRTGLVQKDQSIVRVARCSASHAARWAGLRSVAIRLFFSRAIQARHGPPDGAPPNEQIVLRRQPLLQLRECGIGHGIDVRLQGTVVGRGQATRPSASLDRRGERGGVLLPAAPVVDGIDTDGESLGHLGDRAAVRHRCHHPFTEVDRIRTGHTAIITGACPVGNGFGLCSKPKDQLVGIAQIGQRSAVQPELGCLKGVSMNSRATSFAHCDCAITPCPLDGNCT